MYVRGRASERASERARAEADSIALLHHAHQSGCTAQYRQLQRGQKEMKKIHLLANEIIPIFVPLYGVAGCRPIKNARTLVPRGFELNRLF